MRSKVALGQFRAQNILSSASNMDKMAWNCELEKLAEEVVAKCRKNLPPIGRKYGRNYLLFGPSSTVYQRQFPLQSAMKQWSAISNLAWPASNIFNGNLALRPFANIIRAKTVSVGCSADKCRGRSAVACVFSSPNVRRRSKVYISGTPCQDDHQCNRFSPAFCENGLCVNSVRPTTTALPTTTSTTASTTITTHRQQHRQQHPPAQQQHQQQHQQPQRQRLQEDGALIVQAHYIVRLSEKLR
ncbi:hypothetical protein KIN20_023984 [Parelaphostrongylus tenuis]|uniref:SCP domain-containing protein n=1 Tax=Parelaphostrongylus tenuis TaxID=148309 RepID=A0AAD5QWF9_PARTN|nr:hypothetical protein KIN20_023984 [Parelaphostrongylus tenuis]